MKEARQEKDYILDVTIYIKLWRMQTNPHAQRADLLSEG